MSNNYKNAVSLEDGSVESFLLKVGGKDFFCDCGGNVFHKPSLSDMSFYRCNTCGTIYKRGRK